MGSSSSTAQRSSHGAGHGTGTDSTVVASTVAAAADMRPAEEGSVHRGRERKSTGATGSFDPAVTPSTTVPMCYVPQQHSSQPANTPASDEIDEEERVAEVRRFEKS